jgi:hypothetical protein
MARRKKRQPGDGQDADALQTAEQSVEKPDAPQQYFTVGSEEQKMARAAHSPKAPEATPARDAPSYGEMLLHWVTQGYEVGQLVGDIRGKNNVEPYFKEYERRVRRCAEVVAEIEAMGTVPPEKVANLKVVAKEPARLEELERELHSLKIGPRMNELRAEFMSLNTKGFEAAAETIQAKFSDPSRMDEIERDIKDLKHRIKERFFEREFSVHLEPAPQAAREAALAAETVFIIHKDGTLLSVKSKQSKDNLDKKMLSQIILAIRARMVGESAGTFDSEGCSVSMCSGQHVCVAIAFKGTEQPVVRKVVEKVVQILERKNAAALSVWNGDRGSLLDMDKYPTALFTALEQVEKH